jgi:hypothetical protein
VHLRIIEDETAMLSPDDRARADEELAGVAGSLTFGRLRSKAHRLVLKLDPDAARKRKEQARQDAHVVRELAVLRGGREPACRPGPVPRARWLRTFGSFRVGRAVAIMRA